MRIVKRGTFPQHIKKYVLESEGDAFEAVVALRNGRTHVSFSTQVGCAMGCTFCATGKQGAKRDLSTAEMIEQVRLVCEDSAAPAFCLEASAQGEPLANLPQLLPALDHFSRTNDIAVCTAGIVDGIEALAGMRLPCDLSVTLHSADQEKRNRLMPGVSRYPLDALHDALRAFSSRQGKTITLLYGLIAGLNDNDADASALAGFCQGLDCRVVLSGIRSIGGESDGSGVAVSANAISAFCALAAEHGVFAEIAPSMPASPRSVKYYGR